jgi:hypothetical protein
MNRVILTFMILILIHLTAFAGTGDTTWMTKGKYGVFMHYQYRILLGYCQVNSKLTQHPGEAYPPASAMTSQEWNQFVDGFDAKGFANQMAKAKVGWVMFGVEDACFSWRDSPNSKFNEYTGYAPGQKCSNRDLIMDLADELNARGVKLILYYAGLNADIYDQKTYLGLDDDGNVKTAPSASCRRKRIAILREYANRFGTKVAGWWFDGTDNINAYSDTPNDWKTIDSVVHKANPKAVIAFSYGSNEQACLKAGVDDYTGGDTWDKLDLTQFTPYKKPPQNNILWHGKIYCGNIYHGLGFANQYTDQELIDWINTCNRQGGVCTLDWPFDPKTGLIKDFGMKQMINIRNAIK